MQVDPLIVSIAGAVIAALVSLVWYFVKQDRAVAGKQMEAVRVENAEHHKSLSTKVDRVESDLLDIKSRMGNFISRVELERAIDRVIGEQKEERAENRGFFTGWMTRIEARLDHVQDRAAFVPKE